MRQTDCFNGAMTSRPWRASLTDWDVEYRLGLQWSHDLAAMESRPRVQAPVGHPVASMEP